MHRFDVKYTFDNYWEYYKYILIRQRMLRDLLFCALFVGVAVYWWIDQSEATANNTLPILALVMALLFPLMNLLTLPMLKKQLHARQAEIDRTHLNISFEDEEIIYENLTIKPEPAPEEIKDEKPEEKEGQPETEENKEQEEVKEKINEEPKEDNKDERIFRLKYANFMQVRETKGLFLFYLDRQTVIILPKETYQNGDDFSEFRSFILSKINPKRVKHFKK